ncbi:MAG: DUF6448 family protein [Ignavibacteriaceae bacterium]|nr:DUF6448 family protein [Ignavibacteriaceae bacterium]
MLLKSKLVMMFLLASFVFIFTNTTSAHCDSMEGPVVKASQKALETGNINYVLVWVQAKDDPEILNLFEKVLRVRKLNDEAKELADMHFFETVVRIHRMGEGEPYTGLKPAGYHPSEGIEAADVAIEKNSLSEVLNIIPEENQKKVEELFTDLQSKKNYDVNDVEAGRKYVAAYVHFIHYAEELISGETEHGMH